MACVNNVCVSSYTDHGVHLGIATQSYLELRLSYRHLVYCCVDGANSCLYVDLWIVSLLDVNNESS